MELAFLQHNPRPYQYAILCGIAFFLRAGLFFFYVQHEERYRQPDSVDYHFAAWTMSQGKGMHYFDGRPMFWRTPGYPLLLSYFLNPAQRNPHFSAHTPAHKKILWFQIALCSCIPILAGALAAVLTHSPPIVWATAIFSALHIGYVLASTYLLTDGIAALFFIIFLICLFSLLQWLREEFSVSQRSTAATYALLAGAALALSAYTWMRPMGQFVAIIAFFMLLFGAGKTWRTSATRALFFVVLFAATIAPWFVRNYRWTEQIFFCPLFGLYLNVFNAPKILARTAHIPLENAHACMTKAANVVVNQEAQRYRLEKRSTVICGENLCFRTAWPVIKAHPGYFVYDWIVEVLKTTFDLYSSQLVALANNCFSWDPLVEYLPEKLYDCIYGKPLPWFFRLIAWLEAFTYILLWIGILSGAWFFVVQPLWYKRWDIFYTYGYVWITCGILIGMVVGQSGGFGYARLRLPIELLIFILAAVFWQWYFISRKESH